MAAITVSRQSGSDGDAVAHLVAERLGFRLLGRELLDAIADRVNVTPPTAQRGDEWAFGWASGLVHSMLIGIQGKQLTPEGYQYLAAQLIREAALEGNVVVLGRGGQLVLHGWPHSLHVCIVAPFDERVKRVAARDQLRLDVARRRVQEADEGRRNHTLSVGHREPDDPTLYDLVLNTGQISAEAAAGIVVDAARHAGVYPGHWAERRSRKPSA